MMEITFITDEDFSNEYNEACRVVNEIKYYVKKVSTIKKSTSNINELNERYNVILNTTNGLYYTIEDDMEKSLDSIIDIQISLNDLQNRLNKHKYSLEKYLRTKKED